MDFSPFLLSHSTVNLLLFSSLGFRFDSIQLEIKNSILFFFLSLSLNKLVCFSFKLLCYFEDRLTEIATLLLFFKKIKSVFFLKLIKIFHEVL